MVLGFFRALCFLFLLLGCSNPYERDNPQDTIHTYTVTFSSNEVASGVPPADITGHYGDRIQLPYQGSLTRSGYSFAGWDAVSPYKVTGNATIYARWIPVYTVAFDGNGATGGLPPAAVSADSGTVIQIPANGTLERAGYSFGGWNAVSPYKVTSNVTLYAKWIPVYTVSFDGNGATGGLPPAAVSADSGSIVTLPANGTLERAGYSFAGWNTDSSGAGTRYEAGSSYTLADNITLYAVWVYCPGYNPGTNICDVRDLRLYKITIIGTQTWLAENLNYEVGSSKCYDEQSNCDKYGRLYNWAAAMNNAPSSTAVPSGVRGVCPVGWHLPSYAEWEIMTAYIGGASTEGKKLKATSGWNNNGNGTDEYGFSALPGGYGRSDGSFSNAGDFGGWWSASEYNSDYAYYRNMNYGNDEYAYWVNDYKFYLFSVRCLQD